MLNAATVDAGTYRYDRETPCSTLPAEGDGTVTFPGIFTAKPGDLLSRFTSREPFRVDDPDDPRHVHAWEIVAEVSRSQTTAIYTVRRRP